MTVKVVPKSAVHEWVYALHRQGGSMPKATLLGGDRWSCVRECVVAEEDGQILGIATIAPKGEEQSGEPTMVALYVQYEYRGRGIGYQLFEAAVDHMIAKGLVPVRVDVLNSKVFRMIERLPEEKRNQLCIVDSSMDGGLDAIMEA
ncbi:MAG: hypothetical protein A3H70_05015 [Candidatus Komeilibacteria bacterium RIFCSPLOWO2_02_FULL_48_11]|uniref:N-acetyltransferase domain-containing protein n=1 Tax=Candidatus Komeilibacteria bacterium RIFCSPLOWO2_02_FULL_48_11 TaxID=1798553 RepID=A0A1G2BWI6_9BACT|nr:MAG: hypothetical protein A3H70_05015 [Candidatus Komeilibacteria bacterium RIFCSPLOWO2_02_FULL_48_11]